MLKPALFLAILLASPPAFAQAPAVDDGPTFDQLVADAGSFVLTVVLETKSVWRQLPQKRVIVTEVTVRVDRTLKGGADAVMTLTLLGGTVGDVTQRAAGVPRFLVGDTDVLFLAASRSVVSPIVGMSRGRFRVVMGHGGAGRYVANSGLQPIRAVSEYAHPTKLGAGDRALTLDEFINTVNARLGR